ncbi:MAG: acyl-CoA dehydrogenase [Gammaproteobacteria bacterium]|nr:acyl-CoA dehydrogenase [Gammaproteobacteria bacterium]
MSDALASGFFWGPLLILGLLTLLYLRVPRVIGLLVGAALLVPFTLFAGTAWVGKVIVWLVFLSAAAVLLLPALRRPLFSDRALRAYREHLPRLSDTERDALEAGSAWWERAFFSGRPVWSRLLKASLPELTQVERDFLAGSVETLCVMLDDHAINRAGDLPGSVWAFLRREHYFGLVIPVEHGGMGFSAHGLSAVVQKIATRSIAAAVIVMVPNSAGPARLILRYGTLEQKQHNLPRLAAGEDIPCLALTGPESGSDAASMPDAGIICRGDPEGDAEALGIRLDFNKRYITLAPVATLLVVAFKVFDPDGLLGDSVKRGITLALVPADAPGVICGGRHDPMGVGFPNGPVRGHNVFVPLANVIGGAEGLGHGWRMLVETLIDGRAVSLPTLSTATAKVASRVTGGYARIRYQFKSPIGRFEGVQEPLARIAGHTYVLDALRRLLLLALASGRQPTVAAAVAKYNSTARCRDVLVDAMDIHAGAGVCLGPRNLIGEYSKFPWLGATVEGANILTRSLLIYGQGVLRGHHYLHSEIQAMAQSDGAEAFDRIFVKHVGFTISNGVRTIVLGLTGGFVARTPARLWRLRRYFRRLARMSAAFAFVTDVLLLELRHNFKAHGRISGRMADVLSELFLAAAVVKRFHDDGRDERDRPLVEWALQEGLFRMQEALQGVIGNMRRRWLGRILGLCIFPWGRPFRRPSDALGSTLANMLLVPCAERDRLTGGLCLTPGGPLARLEDALQQVIAVEPLERKLRSGVEHELVASAPLEQRLAHAAAARILTEEEAERLRSAEAARLEALRVDEFETDDVTRSSAESSVPSLP